MGLYFSSVYNWVYVLVLSHVGIAFLLCLENGFIHGLVVSTIGFTFWFCLSRISFPVSFFPGSRVRGGGAYLIQFQRPQKT